jgi:hypothetical protein
VLNAVVRVESICGCVAEDVTRHTAAVLVDRDEVCLIRVMALMVVTDSYAV